MVATTVLAKIYGTETKRINEDVRRNIQRFSLNFCFQVSEQELLKCSRSQTATLELKQGQYSKFSARVFTE